MRGIGFHHGKVDEVAAERRRVCPAVVVGEQLACDLVGWRQDSYAADFIFWQGSVEGHLSLVNDRELDRNARHEHQRPDPIAVDRNCSTQLHGTREQWVEPALPDHLAQLSVRLLLADQAVDVDRFAELTVGEDDRGATPELAVALGQERRVQPRQDLGHPLMVWSPKQEASRCCKRPRGAGRTPSPHRSALRG